MNKGPVAFIDSGIGGLPYLLWFRERMPGEDLVYCADTKYFPYGKRGADEVRGIVIELAGRVCRRLSPKMFVVACNTASVSALSDLRSRFDVPFIGVVPAVKPAAGLSRKKTIGIMATDRTVEEAYTEGLIRDFARNCRIIKYADGDIIDFVENRLLDSTETERSVFAKRAAAALKEADTVVLACTHFLHIREDLGKEFGSGVEIVDSVEGVGRQAIRILRTNGLEAGNGGRARLFTSNLSEKSGMYRQYAEKYGLEFMGVL